MTKQAPISRNPQPFLKGRLAGISYPADPLQTLGYFQTALDQQDSPPPLPDDGVLVVPHIDFRVNLDLYANAYQSLTTRPHFPKTVFILGVGHRCPHEFSCCPLDYETILGRVPHHHDVWQTLFQASGLKIDLSPRTYDGEHSLEYVVIWLQALRDLYFPGQAFRIVPLLLGGLHDDLLLGSPSPQGSPFHRFTEGFRQAVDSVPAHERLIIASIDGCHVGPRFDHGFEGDALAQQLVQTWETELWSHCTSSTYPAFFDHLHGIRNLFHFDGVGVLSLLLRAFPLRALREGHELWHENQDQSFVTFSAGRLLPA